MGNVRIELNHDAIGKILRSDKVRDDLFARAKAIAARAGDGFEANVEIGTSRARAEVRTKTMEARRAEATERTLSQSLDAGR